MTIDLATAQAFLQTNWGWAAGLAGSMLALTALAGALLNPERKDEIALWLMGAASEESWSRSFVSLFDAVFGEHHLSWRCMWRSAIASLVAVAVIWLLMGNVGALELRARSDLSLGGVLLIGLAVNVVADYVSLLETRWLLAQMHRFRSFWMQFVVLVVDLAFSATIIWIAISDYLSSPLHGGEIESFAEILGVFSIFSVFFYSTFLTSVWSWAYILSTWVLRLFTRLRLAHWLNVEHKPILILGNVLTLIVFLGALAIAAPMQKDNDGLTVADRALCVLFKGRVCLDVAELAVVERAQLDLIVLACQGGLTEECMKRGFAARDVRPKQAARLWTVACDSGDAEGCTNLGVLHRKGIGTEPNPKVAAQLYQQGCDGGSAVGCTNLGLLYEKGIGVDRNSRAAAGFYRKGCDGGNALGCTGLGLLYEKGIGVEPNPKEAARFYQKGCDGGHAGGCTNLGIFHRRGIGVDPNPKEAARLYQKGCSGGHAGGCNNLGFLRENGIGVDPNLDEAVRLYQQGCDGGNPTGCTNLGMLYRRGIGVKPDSKEAARLYRMGCDGGSARSCVNLGVLHQMGIEIEPDPEEAARLYRKGCKLGIHEACRWAEALAPQ